MMGWLVALILLSAVSQIQTAEVPQQIPVTVAEVGDNVNLTCSYTEKERQFINWLKLTPGYMLQTVAIGTHAKLTLSGQFMNSRFNVTRGKSQFLLTIKNVSKEDEAMYICQNRSSYELNSTGMFLAVNDHKDLQPIYLKQSPETASIQPGASMTLQCSLLNKNKETCGQCPGEHSVHWFRAGSEGLHPGIIYTHSNRSDKQEERSCDYSLSKTIQNSSDAGTYYCAVVTCGVILFGPGTKVETIPKLDPVNIILGGLLACCVILIAALIFYLNQGRACEHCKGSMSACHIPGRDKGEDLSTDLDGGGADAMNYVALDFSKRRKRRGKKSKSPEECVYSSVKADDRTLN